MQPVSIIIPTVRPQNIPALIQNIKDKSGLLEGEYEILVQEDDGSLGCPKKVKMLVERSKHDLVCFLGDDVLLEQDCLKIAIQVLENNDLLIVGLNDQHSTKNTHWLASKKLLPFLEDGEFFYTGFYHNFCDDFLRIQAERIGKYGWSPEAKLVHNHPVFGTAQTDVHYKKIADPTRWEHDQKLFEERCCKISVSMIVKNESAMLRRCLESIKGVDEIVVVDTGSVDNTKEVAREFTDKVYDFAWCDDFSAARNFALSKCTSDWVLSIDADEFMEPGGVEKLRKHLFTAKETIGIQMRSVSNTYHVPRCFRNIPTLQWQGRVHELVVSGAPDKTDVTITFESSPAHALDQNRNIRILESASAEDPKNTRYLYYLAREYGYRARWEDAITTFDRYLAESTWLAERADALFMKGLCCWFSGRGEETRECCLSALSINSNFQAAAKLMAEASWEHNKLPWLRMAHTATNEGCLFVRTNHLYL